MFHCGYGIVSLPHVYVDDPDGRYPAEVGDCAAEGLVGRAQAELEELAVVDCKKERERERKRGL